MRAYLWVISSAPSDALCLPSTNLTPSIATAITISLRVRWSDTSHFRFLFSRLFNYLTFPHTFSNKLVYAHKSLTSIRTGITLTQEISWGRIHTFIILSLPIPEHAIFLHLFSYFLHQHFIIFGIRDLSIF